MTWIPPRAEDIASPLNPFYNLTDSEVKSLNPDLAKKLKESKKMDRKEQLSLHEAIANVWIGDAKEQLNESEEVINEEVLVEELTNDITTIVESIQDEVGFELSEDEINYIVDQLLEAEDEEEEEGEDDDEKKMGMMKKKK
tara:strand:+ start:482 stop:904 length:423 start_codon:yes stop_codon:yes gene_type:complete